ncbi:hypothetical protein KTE62_13195 [Burkholderia multivorans]|uniref:hypothetical protein n=1 Tax=Burkholderia multivorans TaxID=87883 RepID=UPI001C22AC70|nr:hypothetical protein [Burkholderia multivorans]MBU9442674.1 hypothetical protein [Burkholderia multivorans]MBU9611064.1 hypothetical protein [Burkholderia multivorans]MDI3302127.1 hypothetical protein [Burkholderia multivorans]
MNTYLNSEMDIDQRAMNTSAFLRAVGWAQSRALTTLALALLTTATSVGIAVLSGLQRAVGLQEQAVSVALAVAAVMGTHLLPALGQGRPIFIRCCAITLCAASFVVTLYGQVSFFLMTQWDVGSRRAHAVELLSVVPQKQAEPVRDLMAIAQDIERIRTSMVNNDSKQCTVGCEMQRRRHDLLDAKLRRLLVEESQSKRFEAEVDRRTDSLERLRDSMRDDPVTARLAQLTSVDDRTLNLLLALVCGAVLDLTGGFCWYLALGRSRRHMDEVAAPVVAGATECSCEQPSDTEIVTPDVGTQVFEEVDRRLLQLVDDVANGKVRPTVDGIREHFNCAQKTASQLRRRYQALRDAIQSTALQH